MFKIVEFFRVWCEQKINLHLAARAPLFKQGEVWWCCVGMNIGEEVFGKGQKFWRPVLVFKKFTRNSFLGLPLTSRESLGNWFVECSVNGQRNWIMLNQARNFDGRRLSRRLMVVPSDILVSIKKKFLDFYSS